MKKIAVYFSGRCNAYELCIDKLTEKFFKNYDIDFFWSIDEDTESPYYAKLRKLLNPVNTHFEKVDQKIIDVPLSSQETRQRNTVSMFFHNYWCTKMIEDHVEKTNIEYHAVVRFRIDVDSDNEFKIAETLMENTIYIPHGYNYRGVQDRIAYGTFYSMLVYGYLYFKIPNYVFTRHAILNPEYLLMFHINDNNMNLMRFAYTFRLHPARHKVQQEFVETQQYE